MSKTPGAQPLVALTGRITVAVLLWVVLPGAIYGQARIGDVTAQASLRPGDTVLATPGSYDAGFLRRWFLGGGYRDLWSVPVAAAVLDLDRFAGGLTPVGTGSGGQTRTLRFQGADGRGYNFRSIDKDASRSLDPLLRESLAAAVMQDRVSAMLPLGALVVAPLQEAAGVLYAPPELALLPDHERLGEYREEFRLLLGWIEERPDEGEEGGAGFAESPRIVGSPRLLELLEESPSNRVDGLAYLRARLVDALVGDWDRHPDQWRWARFDDGDTHVFQPVPRDRDWAFSKLDGVMAALTPIPWPHYVGFGPDYPSAFRLTWSARALDRRILSTIEWPLWEAEVSALRERLSDRVIEDAVRRLPEGHRATIEAYLVTSLQARRDALDVFGREFYELLNGWVDVQATDEDERLRVRWLDGGRVQVELFSARTGGTDVEPHFRRTFSDSETREVRIFLRGGDDVALVEGSAESRVRIRIVGGGDRDRLTDASTGGGPVHLYDAGDATEFALGDGTHVDDREWQEPVDVSSTTHQAPVRDWGRRWVALPLVGFQPDLGIFVGGWARRTGYGFRRFPHRSLVTARIMVGAATGRPSGEASAELALGATPFWGQLDLGYEAAELTRFYGFGNETSATRPDAFYEARRAAFRARAAVSHAPAERVSLSVGTSFTAVRPEILSGTLVDSVAPYGHEDFDLLSVDGVLAWNRVDDPVVPRRGARLSLSARLVPALLDIRETFGGVKAQLSAYLSAEGALRPTLAVRGGAEKVWGSAPYFEAPSLGGPGSLRGFLSHRFTGDATIFLGAEVRAEVTDFVFLLPGTLGVLGLAESGRVALDGEISSAWHGAVGGGLWASFLDEYSFSVSLARSSERITLHLGGGVPF